MKANALRGPLVKSAIVIFIISMLAYFTSTSPEGSVWGSMGTLVVTILQAVQWAIGMVIALTVSLAVMIGIFLAAVALVNPASSSRMFEGLRQTLSSWFAPVMGALKSDKDAQFTESIENLAIDIKKEISADVQRVQAALGKTLADVEGKISNVSSKINTLEKTAEALAPVEQVEALAEDIKGAGEAITEVKSTAESLKGRVDQAEKQVKEVSGEALLGDLPSRIEALEQQKIPEPVPAVDTAPLEKEISTLKNELASMKKQVAEALSAAEKAASKADAAVAVPAKKEKKTAPEAAAKATPKVAAKTVEKGAASAAEHRIFSYFSSDADKKKVADLVQSTLKKDMSYKQVMDLVAQKLGGKKGEIITSHPSLSKDYIRQCRRNS